MKQYALRPDMRKRHIWNIYFPPPVSRRWRIRGYELDGKRGIMVTIMMNCSVLHHSKWHDICNMCLERHEPPEATDERYAFHWYPLQPSIRSVIQWQRRNAERGLHDVEFYQEPFL